MPMFEVIKNVFIDGSVVESTIRDPHDWLEDREKFSVRYVGGIHNLTNHDKTAWVKDAGSGLRVIETGSGREEVWFPLESKGPAYISLDSEGRMNSHLKYEMTFQPAVQQAVRQNLPWTEFQIGNTDVMMWYRDDKLHREPDRRSSSDKVVPAIVSDRFNTLIADPGVTYISYIALSFLQEYWEEGEWVSTSASDITIVFANENMNNPKSNEIAKEWLAKHCRGGFFPLRDSLFGDPEEEFLFVSDLCQG